MSCRTGSCPVLTAQEDMCSARSVSSVASVRSCPVIYSQFIVCCELGKGRPKEVVRGTVFMFKTVLSEP